MAIMNINFTSRCLAMKTSVWVAYPTPTLGEMMQRKDKYDPEKRWPVVYMLHVQAATALNGYSAPTWNSSAASTALLQ